MGLADVKEIVQEHRAELTAMGVSSLLVFGSVARGEDGPRSDVDMLVEFSRPTGLFDLFRLQDFLESILDRDVDLGTPASLRAEVRESALSEAIRVA